jgi:Zn-dependent protease/predicted transcriptional regulator
MPGSFRIGRIAGIDIYINFSWFIIIIFLTFSLAVGWFPAVIRGYSAVAYAILGLLSSLLLFVSVLLHELAHSLVARARGLPVKNILLFIFGGISDLEQEPKSPGVEFQMAFVGPLVSLLIGGLSLLITYLLGGTGSPWGAMMAYLAGANLLLGVFNLIPGFPLDGGRVLRSIVWKITGNVRTATRVATTVGQIIAYALIAWGILLFFAGNTLSGLWIGFTGWFLLSAAQSANTQSMVDTVFSGVTVGQVMDTHVTTVPANISVQRLVDEYFLPQGLRSALVLQGGVLGGLVTLSDIRHVPREEWGQTPVGFIMIPAERLHSVRPEQPLRDALRLLGSQNINQLPVVQQDGQLVGVLTREAIVRFIEIRRSLGLDQPVKPAS